MNKLIPLVALATVSSLSFAEETDNSLCTLADKSRRVQIVRDAGVSVPCEVLYDRDTYAPGDPKVLWQAKHEKGFCEARAAELIAKLRSRGWDCREDTSKPGDIDSAEVAPVGDIEISGTDTR